MYYGGAKTSERVKKTVNIYNSLDSSVLIIQSEKFPFSKDWNKSFTVEPTVEYDKLFDKINSSYTTVMIHEKVMYNSCILCPRYLDAMLSDTVLMIYRPFDENYMLVDDEELKEKTYFTSPEELELK